MNLQGIAEILNTDFWKEYIRRIESKKATVLHSFYNDSIEKPEQWLRHARYQGELARLDWVLELPNEIIKQLKRGTPGG
jgi:hypothetical protein